MNILKQCMVMLAVLTLVSTGWAELETSEPELHLSLDLVDGSRIIGVPSIKSVPIQASYAKMTIALDQILRITMTDDHERASFELRNGDRLKGVVDIAPLEIETVFGVVRIPIHTVDKVHVLSYKDPTIRFEINGSDNIRDKLKGASFSRPTPGSKQYADTGPGWTTIRIDVHNKIIADDKKHDYVVSADYKGGADGYHIKNLHLVIDRQRYTDMYPTSDLPNYSEGGKRNPNRHATTGFITSVPPLDICQSAFLTFELTDDIYDEHKGTGGPGTSMSIGFAAIPSPKKE
jgi:hypothetical protein